MELANVYCTHRSPPKLDFPHKLHNRRDRSDPELAEHLNGFAGFITDRGKRKMTATLFHVLLHLERVQHHLSIDVDDADLEAFGRWALEANAVVFLPDATVRDPSGAVLVEPRHGGQDESAEVPYPRDARSRKAATEKSLAAKGVKVPESLPPVIGEVEVVLREPKEVAARALALMAVAVRGESLATKEPLSREQIEAKLPDGFPALSPIEKRFFAAKKPTEQEILNATWRYEALAVLAWALGLTGELPFPSKICDVSGLAKAMFKNAPTLVAKAKLVSPDKVLDALDLHYRLHWAVTQARVDETKPPADLVPGVVAERHFALNWLVRFGGADWDDVDTPT